MRTYVKSCHGVRMLYMLNMQNRHRENPNHVLPNNHSTDDEKPIKIVHNREK